MNRKHNDQIQYKYITNNDLLFKCVYFSFFSVYIKIKRSEKKGEATSIFFR
jgi:hypothetical protein